jgi:hypothetical protein
MKKIGIVVLALVVNTSLLIAQDAKLGVKGGVNLSKLTNQGSSNPDWRVGFNLGLLSHIHLTPAFSLQPEVMYSSQGAKYDIGNSSDYKLKLNYIDIPVLLQYNFDNGFRLQGGPQIGFLIDVSDKLGNAEPNLVSKDDYKTIDISLPLGLSYLGYSGFGVDARYNLGLTNVVEGSTTNIRNSVFQLGVFYLFDHKHKARSK